MPKRSLPNRLMIDKLDQAVTELLAAPGARFQSGDRGIGAAAAYRRRTAAASARRFQGKTQI